MDFRKYNDFEIISLIQEGHEEALQLMVEKYRPLIAKKISKFNLTDEFDDMFQESILILYKSCKKFSPVFNKSFTRYFELNLEHRLISAIRQRIRQTRIFTEKANEFISYSVHEEEHRYFRKEDFERYLNELSKFEKKVFDLKFTEDLTQEEIALRLDCDIKKVYNATDRIRQKLKIHLSQ